MTRLSLEPSIPLQHLETPSAPGPLPEAAAGSRGSFNDLLHQAAEAAHAAPRQRSAEPAGTPSPKTPPAASNPAGAPSPRTDQAGDSQGSSASPPPTTADASATSATSLAAAGKDAAAVPPASAPASSAGKRRGTAVSEDRSSAGTGGVAAPANPAATANSPKTAAACGVQSRVSKKADGKPADATKKTAGDAAAQNPVAATADNLAGASAPLCPSQGPPAPAATASAQAVVQDGDPQAAAQAVQAAKTGIAAAEGTAGATQPAIGDAVPSVAGSLAGDGSSAAGNADSDPRPYFGRTAGKSAAGRRGSAAQASIPASDASTVQTGETAVSTLTGRPGDQVNQPGNANSVGATLSKAATFDLPAAADATKSDGSPATIKSNVSPTTAQTQTSGPAQDPSSLVAPAGNGRGQATAGAPAADAAGQAAPGTSQADRVRLVERVAAAFQTLGGQGGTVRLRLSPPDFGAVKVEVNVQNGVMNAHLETETSAARSLLLDNLPALRDRLAQQQIKVERFDVDLAGQSSGGTPQGANQQARQPSQPYSTAKQNRSQGPQEVDSASALPAVRTAARGRFDVTI